MKIQHDKQVFVAYTTLLRCEWGRMGFSEGFSGTTFNYIFNILCI